MFASEYLFLGDTVVTCEVLQVTTCFLKEDKTYEWISRESAKDGWKFVRVDTTMQRGFPDILLLKQDTYWQIESKMLKKKRLISIEDDLKWQFGQLAYMKRALTLNLNYMLSVAKGNTIAFIKGASNEQIKRTNYPDFVRQF